MTTTHAGTELPPISTSPQTRFPHRELAIALSLIAVTVIVYAQVWRFDFASAWDDQMYVVENARVLNGLSLSSVGWAFRTISVCNWAPITWLSLMLDGTLYKDWAGGYHITNVLLHVVNVLLVFRFFTLATGNSLRSAFVAALFAIHPLHVESVAWISERKDVLSMLFGLLSMCAYVRYVRHRRIITYAAALTFFGLSLMSKATLVTLPFILLLLDYWPLNRSLQQVGAAKPRWKGLVPIVLEKVPFFAVSVAVSVVTVIAQSHGRAVHNLEQLTLPTRLLNAALAYVLYLKKLILPLDLAAFYPHPGNRLDMRDVATAFAILVAITLVACATVGRRRFILVGWFWFLGGLVPMIGLVQIGSQQLADRYAYFPLLGLYMAIAWGVSTLVPGELVRRRLLPAVSVAAVVACAWIAHQQVEYWRNDITLTERTLAVTRENAFAIRLYGDALFMDGRHEEAIGQYQRAIDLAPGNAKYRARLGYAYHTLKRLDEAVEQMQIAVSLDDSDAGAHVALGGAFIAQRRYVQAYDELNRALELDDSIPWIYVHMASLCRLMHDYPQSWACCRRALQLDESLMICHRITAMNLRDEGRVEDALQWLQSSVDPSLADTDTRILMAELSAMKAERSLGN